MRQGITMEEEEEEEDGRRRADRVRVWSLFDDKRWVCQVRSAQDMGGGSWRALCVWLCVCVCVCVCVCACFVEGRTQQASLSSSCVLSVWVLSRCSVLDSSSPLLTVLMLGRSQVNIFKKSVGMLETESRGHGYTHTHTHNLRWLWAVQDVRHTDLSSSFANQAVVTCAMLLVWMTSNISSSWPRSLFGMLAQHEDIKNNAVGAEDVSPGHRASALCSIFSFFILKQVSRKHKVSWKLWFQPTLIKLTIPGQITEISLVYCSLKSWTHCFRSYLKVSVINTLPLSS